ncbi:hypothetical protein DU504_12960 [Haloplanus salinus]|uniref:Uncharacterized protein n=1 Tax=Haloplanus salinus TaxID=1126245 RepID=A0A368NDJ7_9EURY|nr:hypothetical protein DU504_12960 [Haloplanus salinus]
MPTRPQSFVDRGRFSLTTSRIRSGKRRWVHKHVHKWIASKNIDIEQDVYERLRAHKRGDGSVSETLDRILRQIDSDR